MKKVDNWQHRSRLMLCGCCMYFVPKGSLTGSVKKALAEGIIDETDLDYAPQIGRCRRNAPTMKGWPVVFKDDWCGDHKMDEEKI